MKLSEYFTEPESESAAAIARTLGVSPVLVSQWRNLSRPVPAERCLAIERATNGAVTRRDLRPHDYQNIWPDLAEPKEA